jgi:predicted phosphodiesterase
LLGSVLVTLGCGSFAPGPSYCGALSERGQPFFIVVGDTQRTSHWEFWRRQNDEARGAILRRIAEEEPAFVLHLGDVVVRGSSAWHWERFDEFAAPLRELTVPIVAALGNHEYYGSNDVALRNFWCRFRRPGDERWLAFRFRSVGIIVLESNVAELSSAEREAQERWCLGKLDEFQKDPAVTAIVVACHHPPFSNGRTVGPSEPVRRLFVPPFVDTPKARVFFSGHCHSYEHFIVGGKHFVVSGGGGGPQHEVTVEPARRQWEDAYGGPALRDFHFLRVLPEADGLRVQMVRLNAAGGGWSVGDEFVAR